MFVEHIKISEIKYWSLKFLTELFTDNQKIVKYISEKKVLKISDLVQTQQVQDNVYPVQYLNLLKAFIEYNKTMNAVKLIIASIQKLQEKDQDFNRQMLFIEGADEKGINIYRIKYLKTLLKRQDYIEQGSQLDFHLKLIDILGTITQGKQCSADKFCKELYNYQQIIDIVTDQEIGLNFRMFFIKFIHGAYFSEYDEVSNINPCDFKASIEAIYLFRDDAEKFVQLTEHFVISLNYQRDILETLSSITQKQIMSQEERKLTQVLYILSEVNLKYILPFYTQLHSERHIESMQFSSNELSEEAQSQIVQKFNQISKVCLQISSQSKISVNAEYSRPLQNFFTLIKKKNSIFGKEILSKNELKSLRQIRDKYQKDLTNNPCNVLTLNKQNLKKFIKDQCFPIFKRVLNKKMNKLYDENQASSNSAWEFQQLCVQVSLDPELKEAMFLGKSLQQIFESINEDKYCDMPYFKINQSLQEILYIEFRIDHFFKSMQITQHPDFKKYSNQGKILISRIFEAILQLSKQSFQKNYSDLLMLQVINSILIQKGAVINNIQQCHNLIENRDLKSFQNLLADDCIKFIVKFIQEVPLQKRCFNLVDYKEKMLIQNTLALAVCLTYNPQMKIQEMFIDYYQEQCKINQETSRFMTNLRKLLRMGQKQIVENWNDCIFKIIYYQMQFYKNLCEGLYFRAKDFLRDQKFVVNVNLVIEISYFITVLGNKFEKYYKYIDVQYKPKYRNIIQMKYPTVDKKIKFIDWERVDQIPNEQEIGLFLQTFITLNELCIGPCQENQKTLAKVGVCDFINKLLEFINSCTFQLTIQFEDHWFVYKIQGYDKGSIKEFLTLTTLYDEQFNLQIKSENVTLRQQLTSRKQKEDRNKISEIIQESSSKQSKQQKMNNELMILELKIVEFLNSLIEGRKTHNLEDEVFQYLDTNVDEDQLICNLSQR